MPTADIQALVEQFANDLTAMTKRMALEQVLAALQGGMATPTPAPAPAPRGPGRPKGSKNTAAPKAKKGGRRSAEDRAQMGESLLAHVKANPGQRGEQIAAALGTDVGTMRGPMKKLIAAKQVRTEGQRRGMTYFAGAGRAAKAAPKKAKRATKKSRGGRKAKAKRPAAGKVIVPKARVAPTPKPVPLTKLPAIPPVGVFST